MSSTDTAVALINKLFLYKKNVLVEIISQLRDDVSFEKLFLHFHLWFHVVLPSNFWMKSANYTNGRQIVPWYDKHIKVNTKAISNDMSTMHKNKQLTFNIIGASELYNFSSHQ